MTCCKNQRKKENLKIKVVLSLPSHAANRLFTCLIIRSGLKNITFVKMIRIFITACFFIYCGMVSAVGVTQPDKFIMAHFAQPVEEDVLEEVTGHIFSLLEPLNLEKTLYKLGYDSASTPIGTIETALKKLPFFLAMQEDGPIALRSTIPNDTFFSQQYHLSAIRAIQAWDVTRSGVNRRGDTIVIAVVDDGLHINHPDFKGNIWINYADSISNGIDDDSNGYIDDHYGWNFMANNNDISDSIGKFSYKAGHGTPVAGIIGATGNDKTGICGIMWHVKMMIVDVADTGDFPLVFQSDAIRAYSYVLHQRKLYNASNGKKGAFVVATNSSWGVDGRFPHQAPLWCAMYDSLGKYGILNSIATSNAEGLVDSYGDLPTLCPSKHLIAVNASSRGDNFFPGSSSTTHIDLSAPGHSVFSSKAYTKRNIEDSTLYDNGHSGTSFASPMVAAAIGVLHSYACERILDSIRLNPAKGNLILRKFILEGVDVLQSLNGKNVTSGRLNIQQSLRIMDKYCFGEVKIDKILKETDIRLFPNPGNGNIQVFSVDPVTAVECYDMTGKLVSASFDGEQLQLGAISDGVYFIKVYVGQQAITYQYIKTGTY